MTSPSSAVIRRGRRSGRARQLAAAAGVAALMSGGALILGPSSAGAATTNPLGPAIQQLQTFYAGAVSNSQGTLANVEAIVIGLVEEVEGLSGLSDPGLLQCELENLTYLLPFYGGGPPPCAGY